MVCAFAICLGILSEVWDIQSANVGIQKQKSATPATLNVTWAIATLFASLEAFNPASSAVTHVPTFAPKIRGIPASSVMDPPLASVITIPVVALLLWMSAVNAAPASIPMKGFSKLVSILLNVGFDLRGFIVSDITFIP